jgi:hypothetical protein
VLVRRAAQAAGELSQIMTAAAPLLAELEVLLLRIAPDPEKPNLKVAGD